MTRRFGKELTNRPLQYSTTSLKTSRHQRYRPHETLRFCLSVEFEPKAVQGCLEGGIRKVITQWMLEKQTQLSLKNETLFSAVLMLDRLLSTKKRDLDSLALTAATCLFSASKLQEVYNMPQIIRFLDANMQATLSDMIDMERQVFEQLDYQVHQWSSYQFLQYACHQLALPVIVNHSATVFLKIFAMEHEYARHRGSTVVAAVLQLVVKLVRIPDNKKYAEVITGMLEVDRRVTQKLSKNVWLCYLNLRHDSFLDKQMPRLIKQRKQLQ